MFLLSGETSLEQDARYLNCKWKQSAVTIAGGNHPGRNENQLAFPQGIDMVDQTIYIADWWNDRIVERQCKNNINRIMTEKNQLDHPTDVVFDKGNDCLIVCDCENRRIVRSFLKKENKKADEILISDIDCVNVTMDRNGSIYVSDSVNNEVKRWKRGEQKGVVVAGGHGQGDELNQLDNPTFIYVDHEYSLYVSDMNNHRVMKWFKYAEQGIVVAGGNGNGRRSNQLSYPEGVIVDRWGQVYVVDSLNYRVMRWNSAAKDGTLIAGGNGQGNQSNQFNAPSDIAFDCQGNLYISDCWNHRIQRFDIDI